jgi:transcriptional regulator with XRE-family HTH domain
MALNRHLLDTLMHQRGITQTDLSKQLGISQGNVSKYLNGGVKNPNLRVINDLAHILEVDVSNLVSLDDEIIEQPTEIQKKKTTIQHAEFIKNRSSAEKLLAKVKLVLENKNMNIDAKIDMLELLIKD